jgi:hypothetical protein
MCVGVYNMMLYLTLMLILLGLLLKMQVSSSVAILAVQLEQRVKVQSLLLAFSVTDPG